MKKNLILMFSLFLSGSMLLNAQSLSYKWAKRFGGGQSDDGYRIVVDNAGNTYMLGYFQGTVDFDPSGLDANLTAAGSYDIFIAKYDISGNYVWAKSIGGTDAEFGNGIALDANNNIYICGVFRGTADFDPSASAANFVSAGGDDIFIAKYDNSGNYTWTKKIGGSGYEYAQSIAVDGSGNAYITGYFAGTVDFDPSASTANLSATAVNDMYFAKFNTSGNYVWAKKVGNTWNDYGQDITLDNSGNVYITGNFNGTVNFDPSGLANLQSSGGEDIFVAKYSSGGAYIWAINIAGSGPSIGDGKCVKVDKNGNVYVTGFMYGTLDFDPDAGTSNLSSAGAEDIFLAKYNTSGKHVWSGNMGGKNADYGTSLAIDAGGNIYVTGSFKSSADFDFSSDTATLNSTGDDDIFLAKYSSGGIYQWAKNMGSSVNDKAHCIAIDGNTNIWLTGYIYGNCDFDPSGGTANLSPVGQADAFLARYCGTSPDLNGTISGSSSVCAGKSYVYSITQDTLASTYTWNLPAGWSGTSTTNTIAVTAGSTGGTISVTGSNSCGTSQSRSLTVTASTLDVSVNVINGTATAAVGGAVYQWLDCNNGYAVINGAATQSYTPGQAGSYAVAITSNGCTDTSNCVSIYPMGIAQIQHHGLSIFPNPGTGDGYITCNGIGTEAHITMQNAMGQNIPFSAVYENGKVLFHTDAPDGLYFISISGKNGLTTGGKFVIAR